MLEHGLLGVILARFGPCLENAWKRYPGSYFDWVWALSSTMLENALPGATLARFGLPARKYLKTFAWELFCLGLDPHLENA